MSKNKKYDIAKRKLLKSPTVNMLMSELSKLPKDSFVSICGADDMYIHISKDDSIICLDTEDLDDDYID